METDAEEPLFRDRAEAGRALAEALAAYAPERPLVLALPRGGVVVGYEVAAALGAELDLLVARKLGAPDQPELGIGAVGPGGVRYVDARAVELLGVPVEYLRAVAEAEAREVERRLRHYRGDRPMPALGGRTVILVDDGLATGVTARAAILAAAAQQPARLVFAAPVCAPESAASLRIEVDDLVCLHAPPLFRAVGHWYERFDQTTDEEVIALLGHTWGRDAR